MSWNRIAVNITVSAMISQEASPVRRLRPLISFELPPSATQLDHTLACRRRKAVGHEATGRRGGRTSTIGTFNQDWRHEYASERQGFCPRVPSWPTGDVRS